MTEKEKRTSLRKLIVGVRACWLQAGCRFLTYFSLLGLTPALHVLVINQSPGAMVTLHSPYS